MSYNLKFLFDNVNGLNLSKKQIKVFENFRDKITNNGVLFYRKFIPLMTLPSTGMTILTVNCFFHMKPQIHAVS